MQKYEMLDDTSKRILRTRWKSIVRHTKQGMDFGWDGPYGNYGPHGDGISPTLERDQAYIDQLDELMRDILK